MFNTFFDSIDRREIRNVEDLNFIIIFWKESARKWNLWDKFSLVTRRGTIFSLRIFGYFRDANPVSNRGAEMSHLRCLNNMIECERHPTLSFSSAVGALTACARYYFAAPINRYVCVYVAAALQILIAHKFNGYFHR